MSIEYTMTIPLEVSVDEETVPLKVGTEINPVISIDYEQLENKPQINGVELSGNKTSAELGIDQTYIHNQSTASAEWTINHNLNKYPSVTVVDSAGTICEGTVTYIDTNTIVCNFNGAFSGTAYLN